MFIPGLGAHPETRPYFHGSTGRVEIPKRLQEIIAMVIAIYYEENVEISGSSVGINKTTFVGAPFFERSDKALFTAMDELMRTKISLKYAGIYRQGTRIQTDSDKIRNTGYVQLKALGSGLSAQRHRAINQMSAAGYLLMVYEFNYHHNWISKYKKSTNIKIDTAKFKNKFVYTIDYSHWERSPLFSYLFKAMSERLIAIGRPRHAELVAKMNQNTEIFYRKAFTKEAFSDYQAAAKSPADYVKYTSNRYKHDLNLTPDDMVKDTIKAMNEAMPDMIKNQNLEESASKAWLPGYLVYIDNYINNPSGSPTTATAGKLGSWADTLYRLEVMGKMTITPDNIRKFLNHDYEIQVLNLSDDNVIMSDRPFDLEKFMEIDTGTVIKEEIPKMYLGHRILKESKPNFFDEVSFTPRPHGFFRKLSRERDIEKYHKPSFGWYDSLRNALKFPEFAENYLRINEIYKANLMSITELGDLLKTVDKTDVELSYNMMMLMDDPSLIYKRNLNPVDFAPEGFYAIGPELRNSIEKMNGV